MQISVLMIFLIAFMSFCVDDFKVDRVFCVDDFKVDRVLLLNLSLFKVMKGTNYVHQSQHFVE